MHVLTHALFLTGFASAPLPTTATATSSWTWDPLDLHLFVDFDGLSMADNVSPIQHRPSYTNELIVKPDRPWDGGSRGGDRGYIHPYVGTVQVSPTELRIYYFGEGSGVRTLCVAVSLDAGATWSKPSLGLVRFEGSTANNIIAAGAPLGFLGSADIAAGTVFIDENPRVLPHERFKMVLHWKSGDAMFASPDGFRFQNMTAGPLLTGSDTQSVVFYSKHIDDGSYVYFGRSHLRGGQSESCSKSIVAPSSKVVEPSRSVNHFVIGADVTHWPYHTSDGNGTQDRCVLNTDENDPPCMDLYTSSATPVGDAIFLFPMMYNHFDDVYSQGRRNDGTLEARMAVMRPGATQAVWVSRDPFYPRGAGTPRESNTGVYEGSFDAAATAVGQGVFQVAEETWLVGMGRQYTHAGYEGLPQPPCRGAGPGPCPAQSGLQLLKLRRNGFVSLSTPASNAAQAGVITTHPFKLPTCAPGAALILQLNIFAAIGRGAMVELHAAAAHSISQPEAGLSRQNESSRLAVSQRIIDGGVAHNVSWFKSIESAAPNVSVWHPSGCAYTARQNNASLPVGACAYPEVHRQCKSAAECAGHGCEGKPLRCIGGICQSGVPGGEWCGHWEKEPAGPARGPSIGTNIAKLELKSSAAVQVLVRMWASDLYSMQFLCS
eukprot:SAG25_NODE_190_length_12277_cov_10.004927_13_plen_660_part_00